MKIWEPNHPIDAEVQDTIERILNNTHGVVVPDANDIRMFFSDDGELELYRFSLSSYLSELKGIKERLEGHKVNLLIKAELHSLEHINEILCWNDAPNVECFVPAIYINDSCEESVTIIILKQL